MSLSTVSSLDTVLKVSSEGQKQDFESLVRRKTLESPPDQASIRGECRRLLLEIAKLLNMVDTKYGCGRLHRLSVFAENVLSMRDKTASTEVYVVLKACKEIVSLARNDKFAIPTSAVVAYYIVRCPLFARIRRDLRY